MITDETCIDRPCGPTIVSGSSTNSIFLLSFTLTKILKAAELSKAEKIAAVPKLLEKFSRCRPRFVCFVGKVIWDVVEPVLKTNKCAIPESSASLPAPGDDSTGQSGKPSESASPTSRKTGRDGESTKGKTKGNGKKPPFPYHLPLPYKLVHDAAPDVSLSQSVMSQLLIYASSRPRSGRHYSSSSQAPLVWSLGIRYGKHTLIMLLQASWFPS